MKFTRIKAGFYLLLVTATLAGLLAACGDTATPTAPVTTQPANQITTTTVAATSPATTAPVVATTSATTATTAAATTAAATTSAAKTTAAATTTSAATTTAALTTAPATTISAATTAVQATTRAATTTSAATTSASDASATAPAVKSSVLLEPMSWEAQTWNNCAPMSALMSLSYYGVKLTQTYCGKALRPNGGDRNSPIGDKHVEPVELANFIRAQGFKVMIREDGNADKLRALLSAGIPVITQQWLHENDDIAHYRVVRGYNLANNTWIFNDSMANGPSITVSGALQDRLWKAYDRRYLPVYPASKEAVVQAILGSDANYDSNAARAMSVNRAYTQSNPGDIDGWRNLGYLQQDAGDCAAAIQTWEKHIVPMLAASDNGPYNRFLWYQLWPMECYNKVGNYQAVIKMAPNEIQHAGVYAEARYQYALALSNVGRRDEAISQLKKAVLDDQDFKPSYDLLDKLGASA